MNLDLSTSAFVQDRISASSMSHSPGTAPLEPKLALQGKLRHFLLRVADSDFGAAST